MFYNDVEYDKNYFVNNKIEDIEKLISIMKTMTNNNIINKVFKKRTKRKEESLKKRWKQITSYEYPLLFSIVDIPLEVDLKILKDLYIIKNKKHLKKKLQLDLDKEFSRTDAEIAKEKYPKPKFKISNMLDIKKSGE